MIAKEAANRAESASGFVLKEAKRLGFHRVGVTDLSPPQRYQSYQAWLDLGLHGSMSYMGDDFHRRARKDLRELLPGANSAIVVALAYSVEGDETIAGEGPYGKVARFARGDDYHHVIKSKFFALSESLNDWAGHSVATRPCVDSAPVLERELAERAGLGFIGKNTMLISPGLGSFTALGVLLTDLPMAPTPPSPQRDCGSCRACLDACPTQAFPAPHQLDARRCISYLTIETGEAIPETLRSNLGNRLFGCDVCQDVCPYNTAAPLRNPPAPELRPRDSAHSHPKLSMVVGLGSNQRKRYVKMSALRRVNRQQLRRNAAVVLGNATAATPEEEGRRQKALRTLNDDRSTLVQEHAQWALHKSKE